MHLLLALILVILRPSSAGGFDRMEVDDSIIGTAFTESGHLDVSVAGSFFFVHVLSRCRNMT